MLLKHTDKYATGQKLKIHSFQFYFKVQNGDLSSEEVAQGARKKNKIKLHMGTVFLL